MATPKTTKSKAAPKKTPTKKASSTTKKPTKGKMTTMSDPKDVDQNTTEETTVEKEVPLAELHGGDQDDTAVEQVLKNLEEEDSLNPEGPVGPPPVDSQDTDGPVEPKVETSPVGKSTHMEAFDHLILHEQINTYLAEVAPGVPQTPEKSGRRQLLLDQAFQTVLRQEGKAFTEAMDILVEAIKANRDELFSDSNAYRFIQHMRCEAKRISNHRAFLGVLLIATGPLSAKVVQMDLRTMLKGLPSSQVNSVVHYFQGR